MKARILLAEDDPLVRAVLGPLLEELGFSVVLAENGQVALEHVRQGPFEAVVSDMKMPGASGLEVLAAAQREIPSARLVLISGYADEEVRVRVEALGGALLHKPFGVEQLQRAIAGTND